MKRVKVLAITMVVALMMMGAGYAWWTDNITITQTVDMGEFDVTVKGAEVVFTDDNIGCDGETSVATATIDPTTDNDDIYTVTITNGYPGLEGIVKLNVYNVGTIPAKLTSTSVTPASDNVGDLIDDIDFKFLYGKDGTADTYVFGNATQYGGDYLGLRAALADLSGNPLYAECIAPNYDTTPNNVENDGLSGSYFAIEIPFRIDNINDQEAASTSFTIDLEFEQWNAPVLATPVVPD